MSGAIKVVHSCLEGLISLGNMLAIQPAKETVEETESFINDSTSDEVGMRFTTEMNSVFDDVQFEAVAPERALHLAIFMRSFQDLLSTDRNERKLAVEWFSYTGPKVNEFITYQECKQMFSLGAARLKIIEECIKDPNAIYRVRESKECRGMRRR